MWNKEKTIRLVLCALFIALGVVLGGLLSIPAFPMGAYSIKIGLGVLPVILSGVLYGPIYGGIAGGLTDLLQALLFPKGAYMPWFTFVGIFFGFIPGLFFRKKQPITLPRLFLAVGSGQVFCSVLCNTLLMVWLYGLPLEGILPLRMLTQAFMIPILTLLVYAIAPVIQNQSNRSSNPASRCRQPHP